MPPNRLDVRIVVGSRPQWGSTPCMALAAAVKYDSGPDELDVSMFLPWAMRQGECEQGATLSWALIHETGTWGVRRGDRRPSEIILGTMDVLSTGSRLGSRKFECVVKLASKRDEGKLDAYGSLLVWLGVAVVGRRRLG